MSHKQLPGRLGRVFGLLCQAADRGGCAPSNAQIVEAIFCDHASDATVLLKRLEALGHIAITRRSNARSITIVATGQVIHSLSRSPPPVLLTEGGYRGPVPERQRVNRDACGWCGVRADVGCHHQRVAA